jgi:putative proteasome-type protease
MTFCLGIRVKDGLVGLADTRVTAGHEFITAKKMCSYKLEEGSFFFMTSGLRSVRDKTVTYFDHFLKNRSEPFRYMFEVVNAIAGFIRKVASEDRSYLLENGTAFSINVLLGGKLKEDDVHRLYQIYPEGNWVEIGPGTPYHIIGETGYGKPVLDRTLKFADSLTFALKVGCLAFDSTRISAADVGLPLDVVLFQASTEGYELIEHRYERDDFMQLSNTWQNRLRCSIDNLSPDWLDPILNRMRIE